VWKGKQIHAHTFQKTISGKQACTHNLLLAGCGHMPGLKTTGVLKNPTSNVLLSCMLSMHVLALIALSIFSCFSVWLPADEVYTPPR